MLISLECVNFFKDPGKFYLIKNNELIYYNPFFLILQVIFLYRRYYLDDILFNKAVLFTVLFK